MKDYLGFENKRNKDNAELYTRLLQIAYGGEGTLDVLIGHHICLELDKDIKTENEIPAADTLIFDHDIMGRVFGDNKMYVMQSLAVEPVESRERLLSWMMDMFHKPEGVRDELRKPTAV